MENLGQGNFDETDRDLEFWGLPSRGIDLELGLMFIACAPCLPTAPLHRISPLDPQTLPGAHFFSLSFLQMRNWDTAKWSTSSKLTKLAKGEPVFLSRLVWLQSLKPLSSSLDTSGHPGLEKEDGAAPGSSLCVKTQPLVVEHRWWTEQWDVEHCQRKPIPSLSQSSLDACKADFNPSSPPFPLSINIDSPLFAWPWSLHICPAAILGSPFQYTKPLSSYANGQVLLIKVRHLKRRWRENTSWKIVETHFFAFGYLQDLMLAANQLSVRPQLPWPFLGHGPLWYLVRLMNFFSE